VLVALIQIIRVRTIFAAKSTRHFKLPN
jgi:hypothetical protein